MIGSLQEEVTGTQTQRENYKDSKTAQERGPQKEANPAVTSILNFWSPEL
jgi:hypothetical protein